MEMDTATQAQAGTDTHADPDAERRARTMQALDTFIASQRTLLARQHAAIARLAALQADPRRVVEDLDKELADPAMRLSSHTEYRLGRLPPGFDWAAFKGCDPTPLHALSTRMLSSLAERAQPSTSSRSGLSELQALVRSTRSEVVDPVLAGCAAFLAGLGDESEGEEEEDVQTREEIAETRRRATEREKIRRLKERRIPPGCGLTVGLGAGARTHGGEEGVWVRRDVEDESGDVDVDVEAGVDEADVDASGAVDGVRVRAVGPGKGPPPALVPPSPPSPGRATKMEKANGGNRKRLRKSEPMREEPLQRGRQEEEGRPEKRRRGNSTANTNGVGVGVEKAGGRLTIKIGPPPVRPRVADTPTVVCVDEEEEERDDEEEEEEERDGEEDELDGLDELDQEENADDDDEDDEDDDDTRMRIPGTGPTKRKGTRKRVKGGGRGPRAADWPQPQKPKLKQPKPKPETYKQAWSMEEQNLLEQLLEAIPEGEKFRWQKISRAMDGRRTPRQVASRVQKYFEKLRKFGVGVG